MSPGPRSFAMPFAGRILAGFVVVALVAMLSPGIAHAEPRNDMRSVQQKVDTLGRKVSDLTEQYNVARIRLAAAQRKSDALAKRVRTQQAGVELLRKKVAARASMAYMGGPTDVASLVSARTPQDVVDRSSSLQLLSEQDDLRLAAYTKASKQLGKERAAAARSLTDRQKIAKGIGKTRTSILATLAEQKHVLSQLKERAAEQRAKKAAEQRAKDAARERQQRASRDSTRRTVSKPSTGDVPAASGKAGRVIAFARAQLGKPYVWGADGPSSYDCSGLTMAAWRKAGVSLPHSSRMQYSSGPHVSKSQLKPGDLVFFYNPISHVALYAGNGKMITAPSSGDVVKVADLNSSYYRANYVGAVRPG